MSGSMNYRVMEYPWLPWWRQRYAIVGSGFQQFYWTKSAALRALPLAQRGPVEAISTSQACDA
jgi:hypothetical protein